MSYIPYFPTYQPTSYLPTGYQPVMTQQQNTVTQNGIIWVSGEQEANLYPLAPNNAIALWEQSGKTIYLKSADATGKPTMRIYDLSERTETASTATQGQNVKMPDYATKEDLSEITVTVRGILSDIEQMRGDLYGVAGRKKTVKKEVTEDDA